MYIFIYLFSRYACLSRHRKKALCSKCHDMYICVYVHIYVFVSLQIHAFLEAHTAGNVLKLSRCIYICTYVLYFQVRTFVETHTKGNVLKLSRYIYIYKCTIFFFRYACSRRLIEKAMCSNCHELASGPLAGWCWVMARCAATSTILVLYIHVHVCEYI